jgi:hypothetical protein
MTDLYPMLCLLSQAAWSQSSVRTGMEKVVAYLYLSPMLLRATRWVTSTQQNTSQQISPIVRASVPDPVDLLSFPDSDPLHTKQKNLENP